MKTRKSVWLGPIRKPRKFPSKYVKLTFVSKFSSDMFSRIAYRQSDKKSINDILFPKLAAKKTNDFVLVYNKKSTSGESGQKLETFLASLEDKGFQLTSKPYSIDDDVTFILIHVPMWILSHLSEIFGIELECRNLEKRVRAEKPYKFMATELTDPQADSPVAKRAVGAYFREVVSGKKPDSITSAEKGLIIYTVLSKTRYGDGKLDCGVDNLVESGVFEAAYPLHDGAFEWTDAGPLNDRQLLSRYWSNFKCWYKQQPLDLIENYFGSETSFYFAWLGFYNRMLIPVSVIGFILIIFGAICFHELFDIQIKETCDSDYLLCPRCVVTNCQYEPLKNACLFSRFTHIFDNPLVIVFATLMSIWATLFVELWKRNEAMLQIRWNLKDLESDYSMRPKFEQTATHYKISTITGATEPYMTQKEMFCRYTVTFVAVLLFLLLMALGIVGVMIYVRTVSVMLTKSKGEGMDVGVVASASGAIMSALFIIVVDFFYERVALWLTKMENPRTQIDFDNSFTYKSYAIAFVNNYCVIFYIAFFKDRFYTYPGDEGMWSRMGGLGSVFCDPAGCIVDLGIQLVIVLLIKNLAMTAQQYIFPILMIFARKLFKKKKQKVEVTVQWECDYLLNTMDKYHIMGEYLQMMIQYGFVLFFVAAFPPAPIFALINNLIELRVDAIKLVRSYRRPVAIKVPNVAAWNGILQAMTYIGVATNAFVIAFTTDFVQRNVYRHSNNFHLEGYVKSRLSVFNVSDFPSSFESSENVSLCYYFANRYPPDHSRRYALTDDYWTVLAIKFLVVVIFEHLVMLITGIIAYAIPDIPFWVKQHVNHQKLQLKEISLKSAREQYLKENKPRKSRKMQN